MYNPSFITRHSSFVNRHSSFVTRHLAFAIRHALFTLALLLMTLPVAAQKKGKPEEKEAHGVATYVAQGRVSRMRRKKRCRPHSWMPSKKHLAHHSSRKKTKEQSSRVKTHPAPIAKTPTPSCEANGWKTPKHRAMRFSTTTHSPTEWRSGAKSGKSLKQKSISHTEYTTPKTRKR